MCVLIYALVNYFVCYLQDTGCRSWGYIFFIYYVSSHGLVKAVFNKLYKQYRALRSSKLNKGRSKEERAPRARIIKKRRRKEERLSFSKPKIKERKEEDSPWDICTYDMNAY